MESNPPPDPADPSDAATALGQARAARDRLAQNLSLPSGFHESIAVAVAAQIATTAVALAADDARAQLGLVAGLALFAAVAAGQLARFRRLNGVRVGGLAHRVVLGAAGATSFAYGAAFALATWAAVRQDWWLVVLVAAYGGIAYAWFGRRWWRSYRTDPGRHWRDDRTAVALVVPMVAAGVVALLVGS